MQRRKITRMALPLAAVPVALAGLVLLSPLLRPDRGEGLPPEAPLPTPATASGDTSNPGEC